MIMDTTIQDERCGWQSASNAEADNLCAGRHLAQRGIADETSADAASGNKIHEWLADPASVKLPVLTGDEEQTFDLCRKIEEEILDQVFPKTFNIPCHRENRLWTDVDGLKYSGKPDAVYVCGLIGLILDYKTGRNEVAKASSNLQLRDLAVLASETYSLKKVFVAVIQPWVTMTPQVCEYDLKDLVIARSQMESRIIASNAPDAKRTPGEKQCRYCRAKAQCPEAHELALMPAMTAMPEGITPAAIAATLTADNLAAFLDRATFAENVIDACRTEAKRRLTEGESVPGYALKEGSKRESITDANTCWTRACSRGVTVEQFMGSVTIAKGKLKDAVKNATGFKGKTLDADVALILEGITEEKQSASSLVKI